MRLISRDTLFQGLPDFWGAFVALLFRHFWMTALIVTVGGLSAMAYGRMQVPIFEATAVVQTRPGVDNGAAQARVTARENLVGLAERHKLGNPEDQEHALVNLRQAIAVRDLASGAGSSLGLAPEISGIVVTVDWPNSEVAARIANDLAQQILDAGNQGQSDTLYPQLEFYRNEEARLWQEVAALGAELSAPRRMGDRDKVNIPEGSEHRLALLQDQYALVRERLAQTEVDARREAAGRVGQFSLLQRAVATDAVTVARNWNLLGVGGSLLLAVALAFVLERRYPALRHRTWSDILLENRRIAGLYRMFDDPARPILGLPRFVVSSAGAVFLLVTVAAIFR